MLRRAARRGSCLRNFLAVITLIAVALVILILWIPSARDAARRNQCSHNLRQVGTALASYHDAHKMFPMGAMHSGAIPGGDPPVTARLGPSWWFGLLPPMDQHGGPKGHVTEGAKGIEVPGQSH